jgi:23S rRNA G2069 N7-methylase RlmK/C1962 C5-methylase RlmI
MFFNRLRKRQRHLKKWARRIGTDAYRLYDRDIPEIPLVLDLYGDAAAGALYKRPYEKDEAEETAWLLAMREAAARALDLPADRIFFKERRRQRGNAQYLKQGQTRFLRDVREGDLLFRVNLSDYLDTGLFLDRRKLRSLIRAEAGNRRILNLFCYTASFSVYALRGGAAEVDSVDMSNTYLDWAELNFSLNRMEAERIPSLFDPKDRGKRCRLIRADALRFLEDARKAGRRWDGIILDPPAFSNSKKMSASLDTRRDYNPLISRCLALLSPGGKLYFSANVRNLRVPEDFPGAKKEEITGALIDEDFKGKKPPVCYTFSV